MAEQEKRTFSDLIAMLDGEGPVTISMLYQLSDLSPENLTSFCALWPKLDVERRRVIVRHLADISEDNYQVDFADVFAFCLNDAAPAVRMASLDGLWDSDRLGLIRPILDMMMHDPEIEVRALAAATLGHYILMGEWQQIPYKRITPIIDGLLMILNDPETPIAVQSAALESIGAASHADVAGLIEKAYDSKDRRLQLSSVFAMGRSADPRWLATIKGEMKSPYAEMRVEAARAAGAIGRSDAISELAELVLDDELDVRLTAIAALGQIGGDMAREILTELMDDPESDELLLALEEALEESSLFDQEIDFTLLDWDNDFDN